MHSFLTLPLWCEHEGRLSMMIRWKLAGNIYLPDPFGIKKALCSSMYAWMILAKSSGVAPCIDSMMMFFHPISLILSSRSYRSPFLMKRNAPLSVTTRTVVSMTRSVVTGALACHVIFGS